MGSETRDTHNGMNAGGWARQRAAGGRRVCRRLARRGEVQTTKAAPRQMRRNHACEPLVASLTLRWAKRESVACTPVVATTTTTYASFNPATRGAVAGAMAGTLVSLCLHPVDTVKTVLQMNRGGKRQIHGVIADIVKRGGVRALYGGIIANLATSAPTSAIYASAYEATKVRISPRLSRDRQWIAHCTAGAMASVATSFVYTPSECVKQRVQAGQYKHSFAALAGVLRDEGPRQLYRGWGAVLLRNVPHSVLKFLAYEQGKAFVLRRQSLRNGGGGVVAERAVLAPAWNLAVGACAGSTAALFTTPFDLVKTRLQTDSAYAATHASASATRYRGVAHVLRTIVQEEGLRGLYRGIGPRLFIYCSQGAIFFGSYELAKHLFDRPPAQSAVGVGGGARSASS